MVVPERLNAKDLSISFRGQLKENGTWVIFDNYRIGDDGTIYFLGFDLEGVEVVAKEIDISVSEPSISYAINYLDVKLAEMQSSLNALQKLKKPKGF